MNILEPILASLVIISCLLHVCSASAVSLVDFQGILFSEINNELLLLKQDQDGRQGEIEAQQQSSSVTRQSIKENASVRDFEGRFLQEEDETQAHEELWKQITQHGWDTIKYLSTYTDHNKHHDNIVFHRNGNIVRHRLLQTRDDKLSNFPFLLCSHSYETKTAFERLGPMLSHIQVSSNNTNNITLVLNSIHKSCYHVSLRLETAQSIRNEARPTSSDDTYYSIVPMTDLMKIQVGTMNTIFEDSWTVPKMQVSQRDDWERTIRVGVSGEYQVESRDKDDAQNLASNILEDIKAMAAAGSESRRQRRRLRGTATNRAVNLSTMFSATGPRKKKYRKLNELYSFGSTWDRTLEFGLEADHNCKTMFDLLFVRPHYDSKGFDIVLNPSETAINYTANEGIESYIDGIERNVNEKENETIETKTQTHESGAASNKNCVASLIMALSIHPLIISIETEEPVEATDHESQWITQSGSEHKRPLRDLGIDGKNQVISIIDSGLDINHRFFGPTSPKVFDDWDHSQRKVVRYDHSVGDIIEPKGGHGTKVAGAAAGSANNDPNHLANGIAEGAKLHIFDIQRGNGRYNVPLAKSFFESMHGTSISPARIANGSWNTKYRPYPFSCKFFDEALHGTYQGDVYIASAGNDGLDALSLKSTYRTIGNPAACKNTLAVGASQSHGIRVAKGANGKDYLAAFSSRGPTYDGRMKPDLVAPGSSVLTPFAKEQGKTVLSYGTSYASPAVAGNAALVRQYFEEGKLPCGSDNCSFDPSGSLVKAVLLNSAQTLKGVQVSQPWFHKKVLEEVTEYDNNQGMGLVQLDKTLPIPGHNTFNAIVHNNKVIKNTKYIDTFIYSTPYTCTNESYQHDFSVTLTWYDRAGAPSCAKCLINDLDIVVHAIDNNGFVKHGSTIFPNGNSHKDDNNNVERIRFNMQGHRKYRIRITAANLETATTKYSMIATGCFKVANS